MNRKDNTLDFFDKYLSKYEIEVTDSNKDIKLNEEDNNIFLNAMKVILAQGFYENSIDELVHAIEIYDSVAFYISCGLLHFDYDKESYFINPTKLIEKINAKKKWDKDYTDANDDEPLVYTKGTKK